MFTIPKMDKNSIEHACFGALVFVSSGRGQMTQYRYHPGIQTPRVTSVVVSGTVEEGKGK